MRRAVRRVGGSRGGYRGGGGAPPIPSHGRDLYNSLPGITGDQTMEVILNECMLTGVWFDPVENIFKV